MHRQSQTRAGNHRRHTRRRNASPQTQAEISRHCVDQSSKGSIRCTRRRIQSTVPAVAAQPASTPRTGPPCPTPLKCSPHAPCAIRRLPPRPPLPGSPSTPGLAAAGGRAAFRTPGVCPAPPWWQWAWCSRCFFPLFQGAVSCCLSLQRDMMVRHA